MIKSIRIKQFQKHRDTTLKFSKGLNIIKGSSHNGKSAIIRAIIWALQNKPSGAGFRRVGHNGEDTSVTVEFDDCTVERVRGDKNNFYKLDGTEYKALRTDVPSEIQYAINVNDGCVQSQFDSHYLLSESSGEVARKINSIVGLEDIDKAGKAVNRIIVDASTTVKFLEHELEKYTLKLSKYDGLDVIERALESIETQKENLDSIEDQYRKLQSIVDRAEELDRVCKNECLALIKQEETVNTLVKMQEVNNADGAAVKLFMAKVESIGKTEKIINHLSTIIEKGEHVDTLLKEGDSFKSDIKRAKELASLLDSIEKTSAVIQKQSLICDELSQEYDTNLVKMGKCPMCGANT